MAIARWSPVVPNTEKRARAGRSSPVSEREVGHPLELGSVVRD